MGRRWALGVAMGLALVAGCTATPGGGSSSVPPAVSSPAATSEATSASAAPSATPAPAATPGQANPGLPERPPDATLAADGGDGVTGQLGSYTWRGAGSDSPWLPGTPIAVGAGEPLTVRIGGDVPVEAWAARRAPGAATSDVGAIPVGTGEGAITFVAPPVGDWTIEVSVRFVGGGSASYAWRLAVS